MPNLDTSSKSSDLSDINLSEEDGEDKVDDFGNYEDGESEDENQEKNEDNISENLVYNMSG
jgi:hypothetical protein